MKVSTKVSPKVSPDLTEIVNIILVGFVCTVVGFMFGYRFATKGIETGSISQITTYQQCVQAGYPVRETYPATCGVPGGRTFTESQTDVMPVEPDGGIGDGKGMEMGKE